MTIRLPFGKYIHVYWRIDFLSYRITGYWISVHGRNTRSAFSFSKSLFQNYHFNMIDVLCVLQDSVYKTIPGFDCWDKERDAYTYTGLNPVISHAPCAQWSVAKVWSKNNPREKDLAWFCLEKVIQNGGVFEHPAYSGFFKAAGIKPTISVDQFWWGFPAKKPTWLYFYGFRPDPTPLRFDCITTNVRKMWSTQRSITTKDFALWLGSCLTLDMG